MAIDNSLALDEINRLYRSEHLTDFLILNDQEADLVAKRFKLKVR